MMVCVLTPFGPTVSRLYKFKNIFLFGSNERMEQMKTNITRIVRLVLFGV